MLDMTQTTSRKHLRLPEIPEAFALATLAVAAREPTKADRKAITRARRSVARLLQRGEL